MSADSRVSICPTPEFQVHLNILLFFPQKIANGSSISESLHFIGEAFSARHTVVNHCRRPAAAACFTALSLVPYVRAER